MAATEWTVVTTPLAKSERWAAWVSSRRSFESPTLALVLALLALLSPVPQGYGTAQAFIAGALFTCAFFLWERRGFRELLSRHEAELAAAKQAGR